MIKEKEKYYVVRPVKESFSDEGHRIVGTKEDIAEYVKLQIEDSISVRELDFQPIDRSSIFFVESHVGNREGTMGVGGSKICKTIKEVHEWMVNRMKETTVQPPVFITFSVEPVYWVSKTWLERKRRFEETLDSIRQKRESL